MPPLLQKYLVLIHDLVQFEKGILRVFEVALARDLRVEVFPYTFTPCYETFVPHFLKEPSLCRGRAVFRPHEAECRVGRAGRGRPLVGFW